MSKIAVVVEKPQVTAPIVALIRPITGRSAAEIDRDLRAGRPVCEYVLFLNDHDEVAATLLRLTGELSSAGAAVRVFELDDAESLADLGGSTTAEISLEILRSILDTHDREVERQQALSAEGR